MTARTKKPLPRASKGGRPRADSSFERRFRSAARRVLKRRGVPEDRIESEIARLRRAKLAITLPTVKELEKALAEVADTG